MQSQKSPQKNIQKGLQKNQRKTTRKIPAMALALGCLFCALPLSAAAQQQKKPKPSVAVMEPVALEGSNPQVSAMDKTAVRSAISQYLSQKFREMDRARIDKVAEEHKFQQSKGLVDAKTMKEMGRGIGADFVCILELLREDSVFNVDVSIINIETLEKIISFSDMTDRYSPMELRNLAKRIGQQILEYRIDMPDSDMGESEDQPEYEQTGRRDGRDADDGRRRADADDGRGRRDADDDRRRRDADDGRRRGDADDGRGRRDADDGRRRGDADDGRRRVDAYDQSPAALAQRKIDLMPFFLGSEKGTLKSHAMAEFLNARNKAVADGKEKFWHSIVAEIRKGGLWASSTYVCSSASNQLNHTKIRVTIGDGDRVLSLGLATKTTQQSVVNRYTEEGPITNMELLRAIAQAHNRSVTVRIFDIAGKYEEYEMPDIVQTAIAQTVELYDVMQRLKQ
jgi:hypothetical protein